MSIFRAFLGLLVTSIVSLNAWAGPTLKVEEGKKTRVIGEDLFSGIKTQTIVVVDPNVPANGKPVKGSFSAYEGKQILDYAFGGRDGWAKSKTITFECADGYRPSLETKAFLDGSFYFAHARSDGKPFTLVNNLKDGKETSLAPFYIIWTDAKMQTKEKSHFWPYQVVGFSRE
jgi:hypothetical protein